MRVSVYMLIETQLVLFPSSGEGDVEVEQTNDKGIRFP